MNKDLLEEIVLLKKKNEMSNARKREFRVELEKVLKEEGITEDTERYIFTCASLGSGISFFNWIRDMDEMQISELYTGLISTKRFRENANMNSARVLLTLIIVAMGEDKKFSYMTANAIKRVPGLLLTKDGKEGANANKIVILNFIEYVGVYKKWSALNEFDLSENERRQFISLISRAMSEYKPKSEDQGYAYRNLAEWLKSETRKPEDTPFVANGETVSTGNTVDTDEKQALPEERSERQSEETSNGWVKTVPEQKDDSSETAAGKKSVAGKKLLELASYVEAIETENDRMKAELVAVKWEKENLQRLYDKAKQSIQEKEENATRLKEAIEEAQKQVREKKKKIEELEVSIQKQSDVYSIYSSDSESRHTEKMNSIAARLKGEFKDFLESKSMEMTIDLGLNLRDQLEEVFDILMNNGIDIKGR